MGVERVPVDRRGTITEENKSDLVISYLELRRTIGLVGMSLPVILVGGAWIFFSIAPQISLSAYHNTPMRDLSVGLFFFLSGFLWSYRGYDRRDEIAGKLASVFGWLSAIIPLPEGQMNILGLLHNILAAAFFLTLIYFAGFLFTRSQPGKPPTTQKLRRNRIYRVCAVVMGASLAIGLTLHYLPAFTPFHPLLWGETLACEAFGIAWLVKGAAILRDEEKVR